MKSDARRNARLRHQVLRSGWLALAAAAIVAVVLLGAACREEVTEAKGFSEAKLLAIPAGSSQAEALRVLGEPLDRWNHWNSASTWDATYWSYRKKTTSYGATHYAVLIFSPEGKLRDRDLEWYED